MAKTNMDKIIPLFDAMQVHRYEYDSGDTDYSVTTLLDPPRIVHLNKRHISKVDLFVKDLMHSFSGTANHNYLEYCLNKVKLPDGTPKYKCEERLRTVINNRKVSGAYDVMWNAKLSLWDMKNTSSWKLVFGDKKDWTAQQNMYRWLINYHKQILLKQLNIIGWFRDWSKAQMFRSGKKYPRMPIIRYKLPVWDLQRIYDYMEERVNLMIKYEDTPDDDLPLCTPKDMWADKDKWAVMSKKTPTKARRVLDSKKEAKEWIASWLGKSTCKDKASDLSLQHRPAIRKRCEEWCPINPYCNQYNDYVKAVAKGGN